MNSICKVTNDNYGVYNAQKNKANMKIQDTAKLPSITDKIKARFPQARVFYESIPSSFDEKSMKSSGFGFGKEYGSIYNITVDPTIAKKMDSDSKYCEKILNEVAEQIETPIVPIPGVKVASAGAIVHSDGSVSGYIVGEPDKDALKKEAEFYKRRIKEHKEEADKRKINAKEYQDMLSERARMIKMGMGI